MDTAKAITNKGKNVILIGMPGVGKTTIARKLAALSGLHFLDTDRVIEEKTGKKLSGIIAVEGTEGFLAAENRICAELEAEGCVIATGGSVVYGEDAMAHLSALGTVVYLKLSCQALRGRLKDLEERGVALKPGQTFESLYAERVPLYEKYADITIDEQMCYPSQTAARVHRALRRSGFFRGLGWMRKTEPDADPGTQANRRETRKPAPRQYGRTGTGGRSFAQQKNIRKNHPENEEKSGNTLDRNGKV